MDFVCPSLLDVCDEEGLSLLLASHVGGCSVLVIQLLSRFGWSEVVWSSVSCFPSLPLLIAVLQRCKGNSDVFGNQFSSSASLGAGEIDVNLASLMFVPCQLLEPQVC